MTAKERLRDAVLGVSRRIPGARKAVAWRDEVLELRTRLAASGVREPGQPAVVDDLTRLELLGPLSNEPDEWSALLRWAPPGHFYSPIPRLSDLHADAGRVFAGRSEVAGIDVRHADQLERFERYAGILDDWSFPDEPDGKRRWFGGTGNFAYGVGDAAMLHATLRDLRPQRLIEIGSGFSSCMTLDTNELFLDHAVDITFVEPYPELLYSLIKPGEREHIKVLEARTQEVDPAVFAALTDGDVLFIDSTHVAKAGSDVVHLFDHVLPNLNPGVVVHIHDVFWPFEYPREWHEEGRVWTELYLLRAFLAFNEAFEILLFNDYLAKTALDVIKAKFPPMLANTGGALWLRRK